jgi:hypothetical protein
VEKHVQVFLADSKTIFFCGLAKAKSVHLVGQKKFTVPFGRQLTIFISSGWPGRSKICILAWGRKHLVWLLPDSNTYWPGRKHFPFLLAW